jgi:predicted dehydrogenase
MAHWHASTLLKIPDTKVVALCDIIPAHSAAFKSKYFPDAVEYDSFDTMLAKSPAKLDAVVLVTPHACHYPQAKSALQRGLHVLVEKPMVTSSEHAYDLWRVQKQSGKHLGITFQAPYTAEYQYLKQMRDRGEWGKVQIIQGWLAQGWLKSTMGLWRQDPAISGGGQMYDSGSHVLNGMMWLMDDPVVEVSCLIDNVGAPVDINGVAIMKFQNGAFGSVAIGGNSPGWHVRIQTQTDKLQFATGPHGGFLEIAGSPAHRYPHVPTNDHPAAFTPHLNFVNTVLGREQLQTGPRSGALLSALMDAMYESAKTGAKVQVKPVPREI